MTHGGQNVVDRTGQRFGRLVVLHQGTSARYREAKWVCQCDCGGTVSVASSSLRGGKTRSCGCIQRERRTPLQGRVMGRWTVGEVAGKNHRGELVYWCTCACGWRAKVLGRRMLRGMSKSCGCYKADRVREMFAAKRLGQAPSPPQQPPTKTDCADSAA